MEDGDDDVARILGGDDDDDVMIDDEPPQPAAPATARSKDAVGKLCSELGPRYQERPGGYTRILKCGYRPGDAAPMAYIELVDRPMPEEVEDDDFEDDDDE